MTPTLEDNAYNKAAERGVPSLVWRAGQERRLQMILSAGEKLPYDHLPYFYSDLFDLGYEAVGELDTRLETVEDWQEKYQKGTVFYLREGRVRGVLLWNNWGKIEKARMILKKEGPADPQSLKSLISSP